MMPDAFVAMPARVDPYRTLHKGLRHALTETLVRLGATEFGQDDDAAASVCALRACLTLLRWHSESEARVADAMLGRNDAEAYAAGRRHVALVQRLDHLETVANGIELSDAPARELLGREIYAAFVQFVAECLTDMQVTEEVLLPSLRERFDDRELMSMQQAMLAVLPPSVHAGLLHHVLHAVPQSERIALLAGMQGSAAAWAMAAALAGEALDETGRREILVALVNGSEALAAR